MPKKNKLIWNAVPTLFKELNPPPSATSKRCLPLNTDVMSGLSIKKRKLSELQEKCAALLGKEAALLMPSGTMANISAIFDCCNFKPRFSIARYMHMVMAAILSHCTGRFEEILLGDQSHIYLHEVGGAAALAGVQSHSVKNSADGTLDLQHLKSKIRVRNDPHLPWTRVVCLENTHNRCGGAVLSLDYINQVRKLADANDLAMHLDGARVMNAATALQVQPSDITKPFDSVSMCFSKGLSCPVGSILAGSKELITRAIWARKALGGGMRQAGVIAAPMLVALKEIVPQLKSDHERAWRIAKAVAELRDETVLTVDMNSVLTNIVMLQTTQSKITAPQVCQRLTQVTDQEISALGEKITVQTVPFSDRKLRLVTYFGINDEDVNKCIKKLQYVLKEMAAA